MNWTDRIAKALFFGPIRQTLFDLAALRPDLITASWTYDAMDIKPWNPLSHEPVMNSDILRRSTREGAGILPSPRTGPVVMGYLGNIIESRSPEQIKPDSGSYKYVTVKKGEALASRRAWTTVRMPERSHHTCTLLMENHLSTRTISSKTCKHRSDRDTSVSRPNCGAHLQTYGLFVCLPTVSSLELQFAVQTFYGPNRSQEGNEQLAIRFYRRTYGANFFILSHFQNADLQNQGGEEFPACIMLSLLLT